MSFSVALQLRCATGEASTSLPDVGYTWEPPGQDQYQWTFTLADKDTTRPALTDVAPPVLSALAICCYDGLCHLTRETSKCCCQKISWRLFFKFISAQFF